MVAEYILLSSCTAESTLMWELGGVGSNFLFVLGLLYAFRRVADVYELEELVRNRGWRQ